MFRKLLLVVIPFTLSAQTDWPTWGHDRGNQRYSPLTQITPANVEKLKLAWSYDVSEAQPEPVDDPNGRGGRGSAARRPRVRRAQSMPLVVDGVMYLATAYDRVVAMDPETGKRIWTFESKHTPALRGINFWPGTKDLPPQIVYGTQDGMLLSLNAKTGKLVPGFGNEGIINLKTNFAEKYPKQQYGISSPPAIFRDLVITGSGTGEQAVVGIPGDLRAWDMKTGKLVWRFHTIKEDEWKPEEAAERSGVNSWGISTIDVESGLIFIPLGSPNIDFDGTARKGSNRYGSSIVALDAATGKVKWHFQTTHHDNWDYDLTAAPILASVRRNGRNIPIVIQTSKQGLVFMFERATGKPVYEIEERAVPANNTIPGDEPWPTQPIPVKPLPFSRNSFKPEEIATVTPEHEKYCRELLAREGGAVTGGPYTQYGPKLSVVFPAWTGGNNWGGGSYDPQLGYLFVSAKNMANFNKMVKSADGKSWRRVPPDDAPENLGDYFWDGTKQWPCQQPPWGELSAINVNTGEYAWRVPLGSFEELDAKGVPKTGTPTTNAGSIVTAGGLVFIGATVDGKFRAFDSRNGKEVWVVDHSADGVSNPITYQGKDGKQYVAIYAAGGRHKELVPGKLFVYSLP